MTSLRVITFRKGFINLKSTQTITLKKHGSTVLVILHYYMLRNKAVSEPLIIQYDAGGCVICISNKVEYLDNEKSHKTSTTEVILLI